MNKSEIRQSSVEKEASAIIEAIRKWSHFLLCRKFKIITDQRSISFMFNNKSHSKIKNAKILRWRLEMLQYDYEIAFRAGKFNAAPDTLSRVHCASSCDRTLYEIHASLCHPGNIRMYH